MLTVYVLLIPETDFQDELIISNLSAVPPDLLHIMQPLLDLKTFRLSLGHGFPTDNA